MPGWILCASFVLFVVSFSKQALSRNTGVLPPAGDPRLATTPSPGPQKTQLGRDIIQTAMVKLPDIERNSGLRLTRDKINKLAHTVTDALAELESVDFLEDRNTIRLEVRRLLEELLKEEAKIDTAARQKIENQKRTILEGTQEWDILYRKYYNEEVKKLGF